MYSFKNAVRVSLLVSMLCACGGLYGPLSQVPLAEIPSFPDIAPDHQARGYALECQFGYYEGKHFEQTEIFKRTHGTDVYAEPQGKGKTHIRHAVWQNTGFGIFPERWGYTFTVHITDDGIITKCSATQQLLK
jgi:hypothetical protein